MNDRNKLSNKYYFEMNKNIDTRYKNYFTFETPARDYKVLNIEVSANVQAQKISEETQLSVSPLAIQTSKHSSSGKYNC